MKVYGKYFRGNEISLYGLQQGFVDYGTLAKGLNMVLANDIMGKTWDIGEWELQSGYDESDEDGEYYDEWESLPEVFQYYIVDGESATLLQEIGEIVWYNGELDMYVWGVTHWGTSWNYVLTNIEIVA